VQQQGEALAPVFEARRLAGRVRECHGDLHLGNLVLLEGQPQAFDAIEFNPALRWIDVVADIAFLVMDLQARDRADGAWRFLDGWLAQEGDFAGMAVLRYYTVYRALVRARVAGMRATQALPASAQPWHALNARSTWRSPASACSPAAPSCGSPMACRARARAHRPSAWCRRAVWCACAPMWSASACSV